MKRQWFQLTNFNMIMGNGVFKKIMKVHQSASASFLDSSYPSSQTFKPLIETSWIKHGVSA
jgi:hypothetical protein